MKIPLNLRAKVQIMEIFKPSKKNDLFHRFYKFPHNILEKKIGKLKHVSSPFLLVLNFLCYQKCRYPFMREMFSMGDAGKRTIRQK